MSPVSVVNSQLVYEARTVDEFTRAFDEALRAASLFENRFEFQRY